MRINKTHNFNNNQKTTSRNSRPHQLPFRPVHVLHHGGPLVVVAALCLKPLEDPFNGDVRRAGDSVRVRLQQLRANPLTHAVLIDRRERVAMLLVEKKVRAVVLLGGVLEEVKRHYFAFLLVVDCGASQGEIEELLLEYYQDIRWGFLGWFVRFGSVRVGESVLLYG
uniref:(northern house mosquito) hypothetical protein n=1 Tax=Culex pipiens TaxID=7175 RepID=A0A8D8BJE2_CULPI